MEKKERWAVWLPCKHYTKKWLLANFNKPDDQWKEIADLSPDRVLQQSFRNHLSRQGHLNSVDGELSRYNDQVAIEINRRIFNTYGWELTPYEVVEFNNELEMRVKALLRTNVSTLQSLGYSTAKAIDVFRIATGIDEDDWSDDSIRKDLSRNIPKGIYPAISEIMLKTSENVFLILTKTGLLQKQATNTFLHNLQQYTETI